MMACFRQDYLDLLEARVTKIERLIADRQLEAAHVALLSLESSSAMVGATALTAVVKELRSAMEHGDVEDLDAQTTRVLVEADEARKHLAGPTD